jgi:hypothetical protein
MQVTRLITNRFARFLFCTEFRAPKSIDNSSVLSVCRTQRSRNDLSALCYHHTGGIPSAFPGLLLRWSSDRLANGSQAVAGRNTSIVSGYFALSQVRLAKSVFQFSIPQALRRLQSLIAHFNQCVSITINIVSFLLYTPFGIIYSFQCCFYCIYFSYTASID